MTIKKGIVGGLIAGIAATPPLLYQVALRPAYNLVGETDKTSAQKDAVLRSSNNAATIILTIGGVLIIILIAYIAVGLYAQYKIRKDLEG